MPIKEHQSIDTQDVPGAIKKIEEILNDQADFSDNGVQTIEGEKTFDSPATFEDTASFEDDVSILGDVTFGLAGVVKRFHATVTLATDAAFTAVGLTPAATILAAAIRVDTAIAGLDSADHHIQLGVSGTADKYIDVANGSSATSIAKNKKGKYVFDPDTGVEAAALRLTITGGADQTPSAGAVEVEVLYLDAADLADVA